ncbi:hypothetical protein [Haloarchaeobius salinus]|uniref:hypothetical protein n=1 Tax=Haloarchaeobius salinus TaxID=1198298 RepID=UPI00210905FA|nr:hypothetical protein [Haloarchaeobius salinus]
MERTEHDVRGTLDTATDLTLAFLGIVVVAFPTAALADGILGDPLGPGVLALTAAVGVLGAALFVDRGWSHRSFARFIGLTVVSMPFWLLGVGTMMSLLGVEAPAGSREPFLLAWLFGLATAYVRVYADRVDLPTIDEHGESADGPS